MTMTPPPDMEPPKLPTGQVCGKCNHRMAFHNDINWCFRCSHDSYYKGCK